MNLCKEIQKTFYMKKCQKSLYQPNYIPQRQLSSYEINTVTQVQILDDAVCISQRANTLGKCTDPTILPPAMGK